MVPSTRRRLLQAAAGLAATGLAGCNGVGSSSGSAGSSATETAGEDAAPTGPNAGRSRDPESLAVRTGGRRPPVWLAHDGDGRGGRPTPRRDGDFHHLGNIIVDGDRADRLRTADVPATVGVDDFVAATDFESESLYVETIRMEACFSLHLCQVSWSPNEISTDYGRSIRSWDERCGVDERVYEVRVIRIPDPITDDEVNSYSSSIGGGPCDERRFRAESGDGAELTTPAAETPTETTPEDTGATTTTTGGGE